MVNPPAWRSSGTAAANKGSEAKRGLHAYAESSVSRLASLLSGKWVAMSFIARAAAGQRKPSAIEGALLQHRATQNGRALGDERP
jgi:hypothetical protein